MEEEEALWMLAGISWLTSRGPLEGNFEASWWPLWGLLGPLLGLLRLPEARLGASWGPLGAAWGALVASWGPLGASWGRLGAEGSK